MKTPHCQGEKTGDNVGILASGVKVCCDSRRYHPESGNCPYLRLVDIEHAHYPVCVYHKPSLDLTPESPAVDKVIVTLNKKRRHRGDN